MSIMSMNPASNFWGLDQSIKYGSTSILSTTAGILGDSLRKPRKAEKKTVKARLTLGEIAKTKQASKKKHGLTAKTTQDYDVVANQQQRVYMLDFRNTGTEHKSLNPTCCLCTDTYLPSIRDVEGLYQGPWRWDEEANCTFGNPSTAYDIQETVSAVQKKVGEDGIQTHSGAMSLQYLECIYA
ncbi:hypothetical protein BU17DRAFT_68503 [Hysterangium stoloniferum]|nr:hypothetical protein BU17DRAFT_68503 [Hysterangium stoloniferum]